MGHFPRWIEVNEQPDDLLGCGPEGALSGRTGWDDCHRRRDLGSWVSSGRKQKKGVFWSQRKGVWPGLSGGRAFCEEQKP